MADKDERLKLYEALELRSELDARIKTIKDCLPEARQNRKGLFSFREDGNRRPSPEFDVVAARAGLKRLELRRRKLNSAIQHANFQHRIEHDGDSMTLSEALVVRKELAVDPHQTRSTGYPSNASSRLTIASPSATACATSSRSKGSRWWNGKVATPNACSRRTSRTDAAIASH